MQLETHDGDDRQGILTLFYAVITKRSTVHDKEACRIGDESRGQEIIGITSPLSRNGNELD